MASVPEDLAADIEELLADTHPGLLARSVSTLSRRYRTEYGSGAPRLGPGAIERLAYLAFRAPATSGAAVAVLAEAGRRRPDLRPISLIDVGAGPGLEIWAARYQWPSLSQITAVECDPEMVLIGRRLTSRTLVESSVNWLPLNVRDVFPLPQADVSMASYLLGELSVPSRQTTIASMWEATGHLCLVIEPGTPAGCEVIRAASDTLASAGAHIVAPIPREWECGASPDDWTHFAVRIARRKRHRAVKGGDLAYEDEKYAYVIASRGPGATFAGRVIRHPRTRTGHIRVLVRTAQGVQEIVASKSQRERYRRAKELHWGDALSFDDARLLLPTGS